MKSKILTLAFACALFLFGTTDIFAQSAKTLKLTKQVSIEQVQQMNVDELVALLPTNTKLRSEYQAIASTMQEADKKRLRNFLRKTLVNHIQ